MQAKYYTKLAHSFEHFQHGIISCLVLMKTLVHFKECDFNHDGGLDLEEARQFHIRREILRSIASHTCLDIYHLKMNTLAFLLIICDELQEWGRPTFRDMKLGGLVGGQATTVIVENFSLSDRRVEVTIAYEDVSEDYVRKKFCAFHKLMRTGIDDGKRDIKFAWTVKTAVSQYQYEYGLSSTSRAPLKCSKDGESWDIYADGQG